MAKRQEAADNKTTRHKPELDKITAKLDTATMDELDKLDVQGLKNRIVQATQSMETATKERNENEKYIQAKQVCSDLNAGLRAVKERQNAIIKYAFAAIEDKGGTVE